MPPQEPSVGRVVHYVSEGSPVQPDGTQKYTSKCRAAIITDTHGRLVDREIGDPRDGYQTHLHVVSACVLNPTGQFFATQLVQDDSLHQGGTWHWPERV